MSEAARVSVNAVGGCSDPSLGALVLDSAFASLKQLAHELVDQHAGSWVPGFAVSAALSAIAGTIRDKVATSASINLDSKRKPTS